VSYDDTVDPLTTAVLAVVKTTVNTALAPELGAVASFPAIDSTYGYPVVLELMAQSRLPGFACYREREEPYSRGRRVDTRTRLRLLYVAPDTPFHRLNDRWPLLHRVWAETLSALLGAVNGDTLNAACVNEIEDTTWQVDYDFAVGDNGFTYPAFVATVNVQWRPDKVADAVFWKNMAARFDLKAPDFDGVVESDVVRGGFGRGFDLGFGDNEDG
jgi:hypothetical protein